jgi:hypothetical protein
MRNGGLTICLAGLAVSLVCCGGSDKPPGDTLSPDIFVGRFGLGLSTFVGVKWHGNTFRSYICDGYDGQAHTAEWFHTTSAPTDAIDLSSESGAHIMAIRETNAVVGTFTSPNGQTYEFMAQTETGQAMLIWAKATSSAMPTASAPDLQAGWIQLPNGEIRGTGGMLPADCVCVPESDSVYCKDSTGAYQPSSTLGC